MVRCLSVLFVSLHYLQTGGVGVCVCVHVCMRACVSVCACACVRVCACVCVADGEVSVFSLCLYIIFKPVMCVCVNVTIDIPDCCL